MLGKGWTHFLNPSWHPPSEEPETEILVHNNLTANSSTMQTSRFLVPKLLCWIELIVMFQEPDVIGFMTFSWWEGPPEPDMESQGSVPRK